MSDQADVLRHLVAEALRGHAGPAVQAPPLVALAGAKGGVGATTLAVNLAVSLAGQGRRVVLADVDFQRADVAPLCGLSERHTTADVLAGRREIHEVLQRGPAGIQVAAGAWASLLPNEINATAQARLVGQLARLGEHTNLVLLDVGCSTHAAARYYWHIADHVLLVTTPDPVSVMDGYAAIKLARGDGNDCTVEVVVNQTTDPAAAADVHARIDHSCQRFLGSGVELAGDVPFDTHVGIAARNRLPLCLRWADSPAGRAIETLAVEIADRCLAVNA